MFLSINNKPFIPFFRAEKDATENIELLSPVDKKLQLKKLFKSHYRKIFRLCLQVTKNQEFAENLTVNVFVQFFREFENLDREIPSKKYLRKLAVSHLIDYKWQKPQVIQKG